MLVVFRRGGSKSRFSIAKGISSTTVEYQSVLIFHATAIKGCLGRVSGETSQIIISTIGCSSGV